MLRVMTEIAHNVAMGLPPVRRFARRFHQTGINRDPALVDEQYRFLRGFADPRGRRVLELGPGQTPDLLTRALTDGATSVHAADITDYLSSVAGGLGIDYRLYDGRALPFSDGAVDLVWAVDVLEHVRHPARTLREVARVLAPGGRLVCRIDLRDHFFLADEARWLECLRYPDLVWKAMTWNRSNFVNRWRRSDWARGFAAAGLAVENETLLRSRVLAERRAVERALERFSAEDVEVYRIDACVRKDAA